MSDKSHLEADKNEYISREWIDKNLIGATFMGLGAETRWETITLEEKEIYNETLCDSEGENEVSRGLHIFIEKDGKKYMYCIFHDDVPSHLISYNDEYTPEEVDKFKPYWSHDFFGYVGLYGPYEFNIKVKEVKTSKWIRWSDCGKWEGWIELIIEMDNGLKIKLSGLHSSEYDADYDEDRFDLVYFCKKYELEEFFY